MYLKTYDKSFKNTYLYFFFYRICRPDNLGFQKGMSDTWLSKTSVLSQNM